MKITTQAGSTSSLTSPTLNVRTLPGNYGNRGRWACNVGTINNFKYYTIRVMFDLLHVLSGERTCL